MKGKQTVILGGGISGLSTAWFLAKTLPDSSKITVLESASRFGGWIQTERENGHLLELGPRTLRPVGHNATVTMDMIHQLGISDRAIMVSKESPAAKNRFIYYKGQLNAMPTSLTSFLLSKSPALRGILLGMMTEPFVKRAQARDESIHSFVSRRFGRPVAENLLSALVHGIYAGNIENLSVRSTFPFLWEAEQKHGSVTRGLLTAARGSTASGRVPPISSDEASAFIKAAKRSSIYSFKGGLQELTDAIVTDLQRKHKNVSLIKEAIVTEVGYDRGSGKMNVMAGGKYFTARHVVSALPAGRLSPLIHDNELQHLLGQIKSVDVAVVNLVYEGHVLPVDGFGFLVPSSEPSDILGVVFDSCALPEQDSPSMKSTRLTVMMGGHMFQKKFGDPTKVSHQHLLNVAMAGVKKGLGIEGKPLLSKVTVQKECIPQYTVGHQELLKKIHDSLLRHTDGRLAVVGASYLGVSVNDCVGNARVVADSIAQGINITGLEKAFE
ncbi:oxygen-dependent protoporphyrinogen oxidase [Blyttiomyces sp. JEL0837]|nr:oxygen-dependent protoporphyrinogen oxidase [Blyttiomyces sp. JEL0837]